MFSFHLSESLIICQVSFLIRYLLPPFIAFSFLFWCWPPTYSSVLANICCKGLCDYALYKDQAIDDRRNDCLSLQLFSYVLAFFFLLYDSPYLRKEEKVASTKSKEMTERNIQILLIAGVAYLVKKHIELVLHFCQSCQTLDPSSLALLTREIVRRSFNGGRTNSNHKVTFAAACFFWPAHERLCTYERPLHHTI